jgi:hypothetical protein
MTVLIDTSNLTDDVLKAHGDFMTDACVSVERVSPLSINIWQEVLRELDLRGLVKLISGSYDRVADARIQRLWK